MKLTLHYKPAGSTVCAVCGYDLNTRLGSWWLRNTWTNLACNYRPHSTEYDDLEPCGKLPSNTEAVRHAAKDER